MIILVIDNIKHLNRTPGTLKMWCTFTSVRLVTTAHRVVKVKYQLTQNTANKFKLIVIKKVTETGEVKKF